MTEPANQPHPLATLTGLAGAAGGWALSSYAGLSLWIPMLATVLLLVLFTKTPLRPAYFLGAIATTGGHVIWFLVAGFAASIWAQVWLDAAILAAALLWLWLRPGLAPALFLGLVQLASLVLNTILLLDQAIGSVAHKALTIHCLWRIMALACLIFGYRKLRRDRMEAEAPQTPQEGP